MKIVVGSGLTAASVQKYYRMHKIAYMQMDRFDASALDPDIIDEIIVSPGIDPHQEIIPFARAHKIPVTNDVGIFLSNNTTPFVVVTGTDGKSTTVMLLEHLLNALGKPAIAIGNIGIPVLDYIDNSKFDFFILELSSFQLELLDSVPSEVAYITNISPDHLDRHKTLEVYAAIKSRVYEDCAGAVINVDDVLCKQMPVTTKQSIEVTAGVPKEGQFGLLPKEGGGYVLSDSGLALVDSSELQLIGRHNYLNALAALAILKQLRLDFRLAAKSLKSFKGLDHRCQFVAEHQGVRWINDSKSTTISSMLAAVTSISPTVQGRMVLILGGQTKSQDFRSIIDEVEQYVDYMVLIGEAREQLFSIFSEKIQAYCAENLAEAVQHCFSLVGQGDVVLLAPACASLDMFSNFAERGEVFKGAVNKYIAHHSDGLKT